MAVAAESAENRRAAGEVGAECYSVFQKICCLLSLIN